MHSQKSTPLIGSMSGPKCALRLAAVKSAGMSPLNLLTPNAHADQQHLDRPHRLGPLQQDVGGQRVAHRLDLGVRRAVAVE